MSLHEFMPLIVYILMLCLPRSDNSSALIYLSFRPVCFNGQRCDVARVERLQNPRFLEIAKPLWQVHSGAAASAERHPVALHHLAQVQSGDTQDNGL